MDAQTIPIALHSRVFVGLVDLSGEAERGEFMLFIARQVGNLSWRN
jgi:hypothetical protein